MLSVPLVIELLGVVFGLAYIFFATRNSQWCWPMGIIGSVLSIWLFVQYSQLYSEALLSLYYVFMGVYGWLIWHKQDQNKNKEGAYIKNMPPLLHVVIIVLGVTGAFGLYFIINNLLSDAQKPLFDAFTTVFSFLATWLTAKRYLENWIYWIIIDAFTVVLYTSKDLYFYAGLMGVYTIIAVFGYINWRKKMEPVQ